MKAAEDGDHLVDGVGLVPAGAGHGEGRPSVGRQPALRLVDGRLGAGRTGGQFSFGHKYNQQKTHLHMGHPHLVQENLPSEGL